MEELIHREIGKLETAFMEQKEQPFDIREDFFHSLVHIMEKMTVGKKSESILDKFAEQIDKNFHKSMGWVANGFPAARNIPGDPFGLMSFIRESSANRTSFMSRLRTIKNNDDISMVNTYYDDMVGKQRSSNETTKTGNRWDTCGGGGCDMRLSKSDFAFMIVFAAKPLMFYVYVSSCADTVS